MFIPMWILGLLACALLVVWLRFKQAANRGASFSPYYVKISPHWFEILTDHHLVDEDGWNALMQSATDANGKKSSDYNVLLDSFSFTVLRSDTAGRLIYSNVRHYFRTEIEFEEPIEGLYVSEPRCAGGLGVPVRFWVKWGLDRQGGTKDSSIVTIDIGITTPESWRKVFMVGDGNERVVVARIPLAICTTRRSQWSEGLQAATGRLGWSIDQVHEDWKQGVIGHTEEVLKHKYFTIQYDWI